MEYAKYVKQSLEEDVTHLSNLINKIDAIYICDNVEDIYYQNEINEALGNNTVPSNTIISKNDVEVILNKMKKCNNLYIEPRPVNVSFTSKYNLSTNDCKSIIDQLSIKDYVKNTTSINSKHAGNNLIIFEPSIIKVNNNIFENLLVYIKVDLDESTNTTITAVSFHETNSRDNFPY